MAPRNHKPRRGKRQPRIVWVGKNEIDLDKAASIMERTLIADIKADAAAGRLGDDTPAPPLDPEYARRKAEKGGSPIPNFFLSGKLLKSLGPRARKLIRAAGGGFSGIRILVTVSNARFKQMVGLATRRRKLLQVSRQDAREIAGALQRERLLFTKPGRQR